MAETERPEPFHWNFAIDLLNENPTRATAIGLSLVSMQLDKIIELLQND